MLHSDIPLIVIMLSEGFRIRKHITVSHPLPQNVDVYSAATQILTECFDLVNISQHYEKYRMRPLG